MNQAPYRALPSIDRVLRSDALAPLLEGFAREAVVALARDVLAACRAEIEAGLPPPALDTILGRILTEADRRSHGDRPVINATGVILHTNLGRAPLSGEAVEAMLRAAGSTDLELNLETGRRASRQEHLGPLIANLTGAEAAQVTVNGAAAVLLALAALARRKDVLLSRGQAVEIGGGFRVPEILRQSGARLVDVGTTNRTRLADFEAALSSRTGALLFVHTSNFQVVGFTETVEIAELARLARRAGVPLIVDNGSGPLLDTAAFGLRHEPTPAEAIAAGADLVAFSGDKLVGGPQAGILAGRENYIERLRQHPLARALRPDKLILAGLAATLRAYLRGDAASTIPIWQMIGQSPAEVRRRAGDWLDRARTLGIEASLEPGQSTVGGGSLPGEALPTTLIALPPTITAAALRRSHPPVIARVKESRVLLDLRTVRQNEEQSLLDAVRSVLDEGGHLVSSAPQ